MLTSNQIRQQFMDFFAARQHKILPSAPMVIKNDPTLMFTNAGMNQFKDIFLGNADISNPRIANTQKCLRVSGKHNDLEEVGHDTYHHTMFEMLGNWSFGDYFKDEAIMYAWELLTDVFGIDSSRLYATVFEGDRDEGLDEDSEAKVYWQKYLPDSQILNGSKKDNFWEMGETGPCGPCSEVHIDLRNDEERNKIDGASLVNKENPLVIEIWNLVFIQYNRRADGTLVSLPHKHVDTGMGFERLCMVLQNKTSNYDTDIFQPLIQKIADLAGKEYGGDPKADVAFRVVADHLRAVAFSIADGQLPSNVKAGYVIRRILRRAIRYGYTYLGFKEPFIYQLVPLLVKMMGEVFPELKAQQKLIVKVIAEEETGFLRTLETGIALLEQMTLKLKHEKKDVLDGTTAFLLYDTYGFPVDLTALILAEKGISLDIEGFSREMAGQKSRSRNAGKIDTGDWVIVNSDIEEKGFIGYDNTQADVKIIRYRRLRINEKTFYQIVLNQTPFYAESGGQVGDKGELRNMTTGESLAIENTQYENNLIVHTTEKEPTDPTGDFMAVVDFEARRSAARNHSATHLLHLALREILGSHVEQKGSQVHPDYLRFDFAHFSKMTNEEISRTERYVNEMILDSMKRDEMRDIPLDEAKSIGAISLFGEKYGDKVRVIRFGDSVELCGGTHVNATGEIGIFKILSEGAIAAGIRRIEAVTGWKALEFYENHLHTVRELKELVKNPKDPIKSVRNLIEKNRELEEQIASFSKMKAETAIQNLLSNAETVNGIRFIGSSSDLTQSEIKDVAFKLRVTETSLVMVLTSVVNQKASVAVFVSDDLVKSGKLSAAAIIKQISPIISGGGGGQDFYATAGGKNVDDLTQVITKVKEMLTAI